MKVLLIFRSESRGGKSIEGIFTRLLEYSGPDMNISSWKMPASGSLLGRIKELRSMKADVYHVTGDINYAAFLLWGRRVVLTIHDIGRYKELKGFRRWLYGRIWIKWPCMVADKIVTVSHFTANDILKYFPSIPASKMGVIHNGYDPEYRTVSKNFNRAYPTLLQVGTAVHKNLITVIAAAAMIPCKLVFIGSLTEDERLLLNERNIDYEQYMNLNRGELRVKYEQADIVLFISTHEGFGMPIIEAQAVGRPLITTRLTSIPEVAGEGAVYMNDPFSYEELVGHITQLINNEDYREELVLKGMRNVLKFTFQETASRYLATYRACSMI